MNRIILTLWTIYGLSFSQITGPDGQDCTPPDDDNAPDACNQTAPFGTLSETIIECEENFDCCTCDSITCGTPTPGPFCDKFVANGDSSAFGVQPIIINGNPNDGATVECTGNRACERSVIQGTGVKDFKCGAVRACNQANVSITCVTDGCKVECDGPQACSGQNATVRGSFTIANSNGLKCGLEACANSIFALDSDVGGKVECDGENACENIEITVSNIESFGCSGTNACQNGVITVTNPQDDFTMECEGDFGCQGADITIIIPADSTVTDLNGIDCSGSCKDANITIINNSPNVVEIEELNCEGEPGSCDGLRVTLENNGTGDIVFDECKCGGGGCVSASGIDFCFVGLDKVECEGTACFGQTITITDPKKDFELLCKEVASCNDLEITIIITDNAEDNPIDKIKGVKCEKDMSCVGILFDVINQQTNVGLVTIEEVKCEGDDGTSCTGGAVFTGINVTYDKIECDGNCGTLITDCRILAEGGDVFCEDF